MYNTVYPSYISPYTGVISKPVKRKEDDEKSSSGFERHEGEQPAAQSRPTSGDGFSLSNYRANTRKVAAEQPAGMSMSQNRQSINISQIVTDFKNTANAVGAPENVLTEVNGYLSLIDIQAEKTSPDRKIINTNLKNASRVLDAYITDALNKPSQVVENWVDALFLQNIDYKSDKEAINDNLKLNFENVVNPVSGEKIEQAEPEKVETAQEPVKSQTSELVKTAKLEVRNSSPKEALKALKTALESAIKDGDKEAQSTIYYETGNLYGKNGLYGRALKGYVTAAELSENGNTIAKSCLKSGKIYDNAGMDDCAAEFYFSAVAFAGESGNMPVQVKALHNIAGIYASEFEKETALDYAELANETADASENEKVKGYSYKKTALLNSAFDNKKEALQYLKLSTYSYKQADDSENVVKNYIAAAEIMESAGNKAKAANLLQKAYVLAAQNNLDEYLAKTGNKIAELRQ